MMTKWVKTAILLSAMATAPMALADDAEVNESLFGSWESTGYHGDLHGGATKLLGQNAAIMGAGWTWGFGNGVEAGLSFDTLTSTVKLPDDESSSRLDYYAVGATTGYRLPVGGPFRLLPSLMVGVGRMGYRGPAKGEERGSYLERAFTVISPGLFLELGLTQQVHLALGARYRATPGFSFEGLAPKDARGTEALLVLKAGSY